MPQNKVSRPTHEIKIPPKKPSSVKNYATKMHFSEAIFLYLDERKKQT